MTDKKKNPKYEKPQITFAEKTEVAAVGCALADAATCAEGPISS